MLDPVSILHSLVTVPPLRLSELPNESGIYVLYDHDCDIRYIGVTRADGGFRKRIYEKHITGSEGRGHKFSEAYNTGRMWRLRSGHALQNIRDAKVAKALRSQFCRRHCWAGIVPIQRSSLGLDYFSDLTRLEKSVQSIATPAMREWEGLHVLPVAEPRSLVDALLDEQRYSVEDQLSLNRQAALFSARHQLPLVDRAPHGTALLAEQLTAQ